MGLTQYYQNHRGLGKSVLPGGANRESLRRTTRAMGNAVNTGNPNLKKSISW